ncbi:hypothetical protein [Chryseobacterium potabilaquae]|uniref:Uncharacterized protein n=1 Tax=Chryseobacterium potabilaquae TaxID=2675057 RepID=A0A6N4X8C7_9FLAO|nr:hypothetical protein [Chryseobacterium potabilaquae]CAA7197356.1 hypothetical protein CHRY9293_03411 [Chryseobacterium potabilaquae]
MLIAQSHNDKINILNLPLDSKSINYKGKDKNGFFIYDKTFKKHIFCKSLSRVYGKIPFSQNIDLLLIERKSNDDEHTEPIITIYSYDIRKNQKLDSLNIYETLNSEATFEKRFLIDENKKIHIYENSEGYDINDNGKDTLIVVKEETDYEVSDKGKFILSTNEKTSPKSLFITDSWNGKYHFEASNRDNAKTIYDINIKFLDDISIDINDDGSKENYSHLQAVKLNDEKIKIVFNSSLEDEMGVIYIERLDDGYVISENPIYFINPGNNEMPLKKQNRKKYLKCRG